MKKWILLLILIIPVACNRTTQQPPNTIEISNLAFNPAEITINIGDTITWMNNDDAEHTVAFDSGRGLTDSDKLSKGQKYSQTFDKEGTYSYHCSIHPSMKGKIIVK